MTDKKIPPRCRECQYCERHVPISGWMPDWIPWEFRCKLGEHNCPREHADLVNAMRRANKKMPSAVTIALQDIGLMTVHLVRSAAA